MVSPAASAFRKTFLKLPGLLLLIGLAATAGCTTAPFEPYDGDPNGLYPEEVWRKSTSPERLGWSPTKLAAARAYAERIGSAAVVIVDDGIVVDAWGAVAAPYQLHSIRKPLMSALIGIHVEAGDIEFSGTMADLGIDDVPPALSEVEKQATVHDLIRSRSGIYHPALGESPGMKAARPKRYSKAAGTFWYYNNWDFNALGTILEQATGTEVCAAFDRRIAGPLAMQDFDPDRCWHNADSTSVHRYYGIRLSARDLARFGLLYLRGGRWRDRQIVPADWVRESTTSHSRAGPGLGYGYMWNTGDGSSLFSNFKNVTFRDRVFGHSGLGVHFLIVVPYRDLVVVHRVDTDEPGPYPEGHQLGRLMWLILDAAGETGLGDDPAIEAAKGVRVTAEVLDELLGTDGVVLRDTVGIGLVEDDDAPMVVTLFPDHTMTIQVKGWLEDEGTWWTEDDKVCSRWQTFRGGGTSCRDWFVDGQTVRRFDSDGTLTNTFALSRN